MGFLCISITFIKVLSYVSPDHQKISDMKKSYSYIYIINSDESPRLFSCGVLRSAVEVSRPADDFILTMHK